jgi:hypothetical protein
VFGGFLEGRFHFVVRGLVGMAFGVFRLPQEVLVAHDPGFLLRS